MINRWLAEFKIGRTIKYNKPRSACLVEVRVREIVEKINKIVVGDCS